MSSIEEFFAAPRKAKADETPKRPPVIAQEEPIKTEDASIVVQHNTQELEKDLDTAIEKERYQAIPKKKVERKFDTFVNKRAQINEEDLLFLNNLEKSISFARKKLNVDPSTNRVTSNTIIRLVIEQFSAKAKDYLEKHPNMVDRLQTDDEIRDWIKRIQ